jgi:xanthine dehydrogenase YagS FAD-binding subunit
MIPFQYARANDIAEAVRLVAGDPKAKFIAGGTNLIDLMKMDVERPAMVIDIRSKGFLAEGSGSVRSCATPISPITR